MKEILYDIKQYSLDIQCSCNSSSDNRFEILIYTNIRCISIMSEYRNENNKFTVYENEAKLIDNKINQEIIEIKFNNNIEILLKDMKILITRNNEFGPEIKYERVNNE